MQRILQNQINMLEFPMVDATDFATPESALSAAMSIKIYGTLIGNSGVFFVTSGTGSLAASNRDVVHIGASVLGLYAVPLGNAQLSDASNVFYDHYIVAISATGAARQTLILSGVRASLSDILSTMGSQFAYLSGAHSDLYSMLSDHHSDFQSRVPKLVATSSQLSDLQSDLRSYLVVMSGIQSDIYSGIVALSDAVSNAYSAAVQANSRVLVTQSMASIAAAAASNANSLLVAGVPATITASDMSDIVSRVWSAKYTANSVASSFGSLFSDVYSRLVLAQAGAVAGASRALLVLSTVSNIFELVSDVDSALTSQFNVVSNYLSNVSAIQSDIYSNLQAATTVSDMASKIWGYPLASRIVMISPSSISDLGSRVWSEKYHAHSLASSFGSLFSVVATNAAAGSSRALVIQSNVSALSAFISDAISDLHSDLRSVLLTTGVSLTSDTMSNIRSAITAAGGGGGATPSAIWTYTGDERMLTTSGASNIASQVWAHAVGARVDSRILVVQSSVSAVSALVSDMHSDLRSLLLTTGVSLTSDTMSNIRSAITAAGGGGGATPSAIWAFGYSNLTGASTVGSALRTRLSTISAIYSGISNLQSRVESTVASRSQLSDFHSDLKSQMTVLAAVTSDLFSTMGSQFAVVSNYLSNLSAMASDIDSALTSQFIYTSLILSDLNSRIDSTVPSRSQLSDLASDLKSAIAAGGLTSDAMSDIAVAVWNEHYAGHLGVSSFGSATMRGVSAASDAASAAQQGNSRASARPVQDFGPLRAAERCGEPA